MMTDDQKPAFVAALTELKALKPGGPLTKEQFSAWWNHMRTRWEISDFQCACRKLADDLEFMPNPFHFEQLRKAARTLPGEAWAQVLECARKGLKLPDDQLIRRAVEILGGIRVIAMSETDKTHFLERRFVEHYEQLQDAEEIREALPQIAGPAPIRDLLAGVARKSLSGNEQKPVQERAETVGYPTPAGSVPK